MKQKTKDLLFGVCAILLALAIYLICQLNNDLQTLNSQMNNQLSTLTSEVQNISRDVEHTLTQQASILDFYDYKEHPDQFNEQDLTVPVTFRIMPKEYTENTAGAMWIGEEYLEMERDGRTFTLTTPVPIFSENVAFTAAFTDEGKTRTETLEIYSGFLREHLPNGFALLQGSASPTKEKNGYAMHFEGSVSCDLYTYSSQNPIEEASLRISAGDNLIYEKAIELEQDSTSFEMELNETLQAPANEKISVYIDLTDRYGLHYRLNAYTTEIEEDGSSSDVYREPTTDIYDSRGNLLYENYM